MGTIETPPNGASGGTMPATSAPLPPARRFWQRPSVAVARALLDDYLWSGRVIVEAAVLSGFFMFAFGVPNGLTHFNEAAYAILGVLAVLGGVAGLVRALQPRVNRPLTKRYGHAAVARGLALAFVTVRIGSYCYLLSLALLTGKLIGASFGAVAAGALGLLATLSVLALVAAALGPSVATSRERIGFLIWLVAALYSYTDDGFLARVCTVARLPLLPTATLFAGGETGTLGWSGLLALLLVVGYGLGLVWLLAWRLETRAATPDGMDAATPASA